MAPPVRLLDLDGTLVLTHPLYARCLGDGDPAGEEFVIRALSGGASVVALARSAGVTRTTFARRIQAQPVNLVPGWIETLDQLRARGHALGVVTSLPGWLAEPILAATHIRQQFDVVVHAGICPVPKPSPRPLLTAFGLLNRTPSPDDIYVGDSAVDQTAAAAAGIAFAWADWGYGGRISAVNRLRIPSDLLDL